MRNHIISIIFFQLKCFWLFLLVDLPTSFSFIPPSTEFVISWSKKMFMFGELNETGNTVQYVNFTAVLFMSNKAIFFNNI